MPPKMGWSWAVVPSAKVMASVGNVRTSPGGFELIPLFIYRASGMVAGAMGTAAKCVFQLCQSTAVDLGQAALCLSFPSVKWNNENNKFSLGMWHELINTWKASRTSCINVLLFYLLQRLRR